MQLLLLSACSSVYLLKQGPNVSGLPEKKKRVAQTMHYMSAGHLGDRDSEPGKVSCVKHVRLLVLCAAGSGVACEQMQRHLALFVI